MNIFSVFHISYCYVFCFRFLYVVSLAILLMSIAVLHFQIVAGLFLII